MRRVLTSVFLLCWVSWGGAAFATESPMEMLKKANQKIEKLLAQKVPKGSEAEKQREEKIKKIVDGFLDFDALSRGSLGKHWKERTEEEKKEFSALFRELIQQNYLKQIHEKADYVMTYDGETIEGDKATVNATVRAKSKKGEEAETSILYKLHKVKGRWLVVDIETDDVSLVQNYRTQFNKIILKDGYAVLLEKMRKKIEEGDSAGSSGLK